MEEHRFVLERDHIELYKLLKFLSITASGGEAKHLIDQGAVEVNGALETRKRRKLVVGDHVACAQASIRIVSE